MASLILDTGVETHPQIAVDAADFKNDLINFRWIGGPYSGDCAEPFLISIAEHGELTINQVIAGIAQAMIATLNPPVPEPVPEPAPEPTPEPVPEGVPV